MTTVVLRISTQS